MKTRCWFSHVLAFSSSLVSLSARAEAVLVYGNGMNNTPEQAAISLAELRDAVKPYYQFKNSFVAYNYDESWWKQVWEVVKQKYGDREAGSFIAGPFNSLLADSEIRATYIQALSKEFVDEDDADFLQHLSFYRSVLSQEQKLVIVSHSQGCFYANAAFNTLSKEYANLPNRFKNVQVASPSTHVVAKGPWITFTRDLVINTVRLTTSALPGNHSGPSWHWQDVWGHSFVESYLTDETTRQTIVRSVLSALSE